VSNLPEADSPKELTSTSKSEQVPTRGSTIPELLEILGILGPLGPRRKLQLRFLKAMQKVSLLGQCQQAVVLLCSEMEPIIDSSLIAQFIHSWNHFYPYLCPVSRAMLQ
jgi:hypothetical protein